MWQKMLQVGSGGTSELTWGTFPSTETTIGNSYKTTPYEISGHKEAIFLLGSYSGGSEAAAENTCIITVASGTIDYIGSMREGNKTATRVYHAIGNASFITPNSDRDLRIQIAYID